MAAGHAARVVVNDVGVVLGEVADDVTLVNLHVVDIVKEPEMLRAEAFGQRGAPGGAVALVVLVVNFTIEQFHHQHHLVLGRQC